MKVVATIVVSVLAQMLVARYMVAGQWVCDLVLVGTVYAALMWGAASGMIVGTAAGFIQDALSDGVIGVGGLAKTIAGFGAGVLGQQFVVARPLARTVFVAGATVVHRLVVISTLAVIDQHWSHFGWAAILKEVGINAVCGFLAFQITERGPAAMARGRASRRPSLSRRRWQ